MTASARDGTRSIPLYSTRGARPRLWGKHPRRYDALARVPSRATRWSSSQPMRVTHSPRSALARFGELVEAMLPKLGAP